MKELEQKIIDKPEIENVKPVETGKRLVKSLDKHRGQTTYQLDLTTSVITEAEYKEEFATLNGKIRKQVIMKENCLYCVAINFKNADRKFHKMRGVPYKKK